VACSNLRLSGLDAPEPVSIMLMNKVASSLRYPWHSQYSSDHGMHLPILLVHQLWRASVLGVLQVFSHNLCLLMFPRFAFDQAALFKMVDLILIPEQTKPTKQLIRPSPQYRSRVVAISSSSNVTLHVFAEIGALFGSTVGRAEKEHLMPTGKLESNDQRLLVSKSGRPCYITCDESFWPHSLGYQLEYQLHY
jgi:hypothetical protein